MSKKIAYLCALSLLSGACESLEPAPDYGAVAQIERRGKSACSGVFAGGRAVLTAAHCVLRVPMGEARVGLGGRWYDIERAIAHPEWTVERVEADIGLLLLSEAPPIAPATLAAAELVAGEPILAAGYGGGAYHEAPASVRIAQGTHVVLSTHAPLCKGDSGGPQFSGGALVALSSRGDCGANATGELVHPHLEWLISQGL